MATAIPASSAPTPRNLTLGKIKKLALRYLQIVDDPEALETVEDGVKMAINHLNTQVWYWALGYQDITLVTDTADYGINQNFHAPFACEYLTSASDPGGRLIYFNPKDFFDTFPRSNSTPGDPTAYSIINHWDTLTLSLNLKSSSSFVNSYPTLRLRYFRTISHITADGESIIAPASVDNFLVWYAREELAALHDNDKWRAANARRHEIWAKLRRDDNEHHFHDVTSAA